MGRERNRGGVSIEGGVEGIEKWKGEEELERNGICKEKTKHENERRLASADQKRNLRELEEHEDNVKEMALFCKRK